MTVDLGALFAQIEPVITGLITTSGTTVDVTRDPDGTLTGAADPGTFALPAANRTPVLTGAQAIVAPAGQGLQGIPLPAPVDERPGDYRVLLLAEVLTVVPGDVVTVASSLDAHLVDLELIVRQIPDSSAGVCRILLCRPPDRRAIQQD